LYLQRVPSGYLPYANNLWPAFAFVPTSEDGNLAEIVYSIES
jgi:hypothetical protein